MRHWTVRVYRAGRGWWSRCRVCPWNGEPFADVAAARVDGRVHELQPEGADWTVPCGMSDDPDTRLIRSTPAAAAEKLARHVEAGRISFDNAARIMRSAYPPDRR